MWNQAIKGLSFSDLYRTLYPRSKIFSQRNSRIDHVYVNEANLLHVQKYRYFPTPFLDHNLTYRTTLPYGAGLWKMNVSLLTDDW